MKKTTGNTLVNLIVIISFLLVTAVFLYIKSNSLFAHQAPPLSPANPPKEELKDIIENYLHQQDYIHGIDYLQQLTDEEDRELLGLKNYYLALLRHKKLEHLSDASELKEYHMIKLPYIESILEETKIVIINLPQTKYALEAQFLRYLSYKTQNSKEKKAEEFDKFKEMLFRYGGISKEYDIVKEYASRLYQDFQPKEAKELGKIYSKLLQLNIPSYQVKLSLKTYAQALLDEGRYEASGFMYDEYFRAALREQNLKGDNNGLPENEKEILSLLKERADRLFVNEGHLKAATVYNQYIELSKNYFSESGDLTQITKDIAERYFNNERYVTSSFFYRKYLAQLREFIDEEGVVSALKDIADKYFDLKVYDLAREFYQELVDECPDNDISQYAYFKLAKSYQDEGGIEIAISKYQQMRNKFPDGQWLERSQMLLGESYLMLAETKKAKKVFLDFVKTYSDSGYLSQAYLYLAELYTEFGDYKEGISLLKDNKIFYENSQEAPDILFHLALLYQFNGDYASAKKIFKEIVDRYPKGKYFYRAKQALG